MLSLTKIKQGKRKEEEIMQQIENIYQNET